MAPREIVDSLESVFSIFYSGVRHRERAAFILCDELVEMACKLKAKEHNYRFDLRCSFHDAWNAPGVQLDPQGLGRSVQESRNTRNHMQHNSAAATVDVHHCADAILDAIAVVDHCWPNTSTTSFQLWMKCAQRITRLLSSSGEFRKRKGFEDAMREESWRTERRYPKNNELFVVPGLRDNWGQCLREYPEVVEQILNRVQT